MTTKIRYGVWETNSSSTHSLSLSQETGSELMDMSLTPEKDEKSITLKGGEFGWEWAKYNDALTKANYIAVMLNIIKDWMIDYKQLKKNDRQGRGRNNNLVWADKHYGDCYNNFIDVLTEQTGCEYVWMSNVTGYIDHQSCEDIHDTEWLLSKDNIRKFVFNKKSWLFTGNDNSTAPANFYDDPETKYTHQLVIDIPLELESYKFVGKPNEEQLKEGVYNLLNEVSYNKSKNKWLSEYDFNSRDTKFTFPHRTGEVNFKTKEIILIKDGLWSEAHDQAKKDGNETHEYSSKIEKKLEKLSENRHIVKFDIIKI